MPLTLMAPPPPPIPKGSPEAKLKAKLRTRLKRYHRKKATFKLPNPKPAKAKLPNGRYFRKTHFWPLTWYEPFRKKLRGRRKKEAARALRMYKVMNPYGEPMACKPAGGPDHHSVIFPDVVCKLMRMDPRPASRYLTRLRKKIGKPRGEIITLKEFCANTCWTEEEVIPYLRY